MTSQKDRIGDYLFQVFIEEKVCEKPRRIKDNREWQGTALSILSRQSVENLPLSFRVKTVSALLGVFGLDEATLNELSIKLGEVYSRKAHTLRPFLDVLIDRGFYTDPDNTTVVSPGKPIDKAVSERAWKQDYQGVRHELLLRNIDVSFRKELPYGNSGAIVQSSGYGKSRTVDEMASLIPTIPMNVRNIEEEKQGAFPPADATLIDIFNNMIEHSDPIQSFFVFFEQLFNIVHDLAKDFRRESFAAELRDYLRDSGRRAKLYADLSEKMVQRSSGTGVTEVAKAYAKLAELFPKSKFGVKMIIYVDEAHTLASMTHKKGTMYDHMLNATSELNGHRDIAVFFLFLSTASRLENLANQAALSHSARFHLAADHLVAPFTEMPFDCHPSLVKQPIRPGMKLEAIEKFSLAVRFGRPLFWAYYESIAASEDAALAHTSTIQMAQSKLTGQASLSNVGSTGKLAILDTLLNLDYDPTIMYSHRLASTMVAGHLRTVYAVPTSRAYMHTGYPSEPVLAEAALCCAMAMDKLENFVPGEETHLGPLLPLFRDLDKDTSGAIYRGERGENVGKMILLLAYIAAVKKTFNNPHAMVHNWGRGCSLIDFLTELTGGKFIDDVLNSVPDNVPTGDTPGIKLREAFQNSWVRFTHFARAADDTAMTSSAAWVAFIRGMAMIGWHSQQVVDICIPVLLDKNKPIEEANMTGILIQLKSRESASNVTVDAEKIKYFPPPNSSRDACPNTSTKDQEAYRSRPYISLVMVLGVVVTPNTANIPSKLMDILDKRGTGHQQIPRPPKKHNANLSVSNVHFPLSPARQSPRFPDRKPRRYSLTYYGRSHHVYKCIPNTRRAREIIQVLLEIPDVFQDRPRNRPIDPVLEMKPFWNAGTNCYSWAAEPYLNPSGPQIEEQNGQVVIGTEDMDIDMNMDIQRATDDYDDAMDQDM